MKIVKCVAILFLLLCASVALADSTTLPYTSVDDSYIYGSGANNNYGANTYLWASLTRSIIMRCNITWDKDVSANDVLDSARVYLWKYENVANDIFSVFPTLKNCWIEGTGTVGSPTTTGVSHNDWNGPSSEWGTAGCDNAADDSDFNCLDGSGHDRWATACDSIQTGTTTPAWVNFMLPGDYLEQCRDSLEWPGALLYRRTGTTSKFYSTENASYRPYMVIYHHAGEAPPEPTGSRVLIHK